MPTKKWIPPEKRPKKPRPPGYAKPEGITQKLAISSLVKIWHSFILHGSIGVLRGNFSQTHKRFRLSTNGFQGKFSFYAFSVCSSDASNVRTIKHYEVFHWFTISSMAQWAGGLPIKQYVVGSNPAESVSIWATFQRWDTIDVAFIKFSGNG